MNHKNLSRTRAVLALMLLLTLVVATPVFAKPWKYRHYWNRYKAATTTTASTATTKPATTSTVTRATTTTTATTRVTTTTQASPVPLSTTQIAGVTIDDPWNPSRVVASLDKLKAQTGKTITARVVFDEPQAGVTVDDYASLLPTIAAKHPVMGEVLDSFYMSKMTVSQYQARTSEFYSKLKNRVSIWEIGNEVNGAWLGDPSATAQKIDAAYSVIGNQAPTAVTFHCDQEKDNAYEFANRLSTTTRSGIDYVFFSQYDIDCIYTGASYGNEASDKNGRLTPDQWANRFTKLGQLFPNAKVGFGEVGIGEQLRSSSSDTTEAEVIAHYYALGKTIQALVSSRLGRDAYVGGYFYWYYSSDMVPFNKNAVLTAQLVQSIKNL